MRSNDLVPQRLQMAQNVKFMATILSQKEEQIYLWEKLVLAFLRDQRSVRTQKEYYVDLKQFFYWTEREKVIGIARIDSDVMTRYRDFVKRFGGKVIDNNPLEASNSTVHRKLSSISSFFDFLIKRKVVRHNPVSIIKRFRVDQDKTTTEALLTEEVKVLFAHLKILDDELINLRDRAIIMVLFGVTIRKNALLNLKGKSFYQVGDKFYLKYVDKGDSEFNEVINSQTAKSIFDYLQAMKRLDREISEEDYLFQPTQNRSSKNINKRLSKNQVNNILRKHCTQCGIGDWVTVHSAKATVSSELMDKFGVHIAQRKAKHKRPDQTIAYYGKRKEREKSCYEEIEYFN